ncbi:MAG: terminase [Nocardioides sp.]|nr:terminase [Nocardioides sp.]
MTTATSDLLLPGYSIDEGSGAWRSLPWPLDPDRRMALVRSSLAPALIDWSEGRTERPGLIHYMTGEPWRWTVGQKRFLILWYALDESGRFLYRSGVKRGAKGTGKDPTAGAMCNTELVGDVEPYDWDDKTGRPIGRPRGFPLVQVMSNSEAQSRDVLRIANAMWSQDARQFYDLDCGETRTVLKSNGGRFEIPPAAEASGEGDPATFVALNESHHMTESSGGKRVAAMGRRNVGKSPTTIQARLCEFTNAHRQGYGSVAEDSFDAFQLQQSKGYRGKRDLLYDSIEAPPGTDILSPEGRMAGARASYSDAPWADLERICDEMMDSRTTVADTIRFYLNGLAAEEDSWVEPTAFDDLVDAKTVADGDRIALFLDCSKSEDATGLMACRLADMYVFQIDGESVWQRPHGERGKGWLAPRAEVDAKVRVAMDRYDVVWFGVDPSPAKDESTETLYWMELIDQWHRDFHAALPLWATPGAGGNSVLFDMRLSQSGGVKRNQQFTLAAEIVARWIDEEGRNGPLRHDGSPILRTHVHNARRRPNSWGVSLGKITRDSHKLVDLAVCMVGAVMGAREALNSPKLKKKRSAGPKRIVVLS